MRVEVPRGLAAPPTLAELASFKRPDGLTVLPELPLTPMYKVDKGALGSLVASRGA